MRPEHRARCERAIMQSGVSKAMASKLFEAGYIKAKLLREATNDELLAIEGIGQATVAKVCTWGGLSKN